MDKRMPSNNTSPKYLFSIGISSLMLVLTFGEVVITAGGAGSTAALYEEWFKSYTASTHDEVVLNYVAFSSTYGKLWIKRQLESKKGVVPVFVGSDTPFPDEEDFQRFKNLQFFPIVGGAVVLVFNIPGLGDLNLSDEAVTAIFNGTVTLWNDPILQELNPNFQLPIRKIETIVRRDGAGSTGVFTAALSKYSQKWKDKIGIFEKEFFINHETPDLISPEGPSRNWPVKGADFFALRSSGIAIMVASIPYSIAYAETADAYLLNLSEVTLKNRAANRIPPSAIPEGVKEAMDYYADSIDSTHILSLLNAPTAKAYPICFVSYMIINMTTSEEIHCDAVKALIRAIRWALTDKAAMEIPKRVQMMPLSPKLVDIVIENIVNKVRCKGELVIDMIRADDEKKEGATSNSQVLILASVIVGGCLILVAVCSVGFFQLRKKHMEENLLSQIWQLNFSDLRQDLGSALGSRALSWHRDSSALFPNTYTMTAKYQGEKVLLKSLKKYSDIKIRKRETLLHLKTMKNLIHDNLNKFLGLCLHVPENSIAEVWIYAAKESLKEILYNEHGVALDKTFKISMASDIIKGLAFLHSSTIGPHGRLLVSNCVVDNRWCLKLTDFGVDPVLAEFWPQYLEQKLDKPADLIYLAPETIKTRSKSVKDAKWPRVPHERTTAGDIYALGMVLYQIFLGQDPYDLSRTSASVILDSILRDANPMPKIPTEEEGRHGSGEATDLILACLLRLPSMRPEIADIETLFNEKFSQSSNIVEHMVMLMERYTKNLEEKTKQLSEQRAKADSLLFKILPKSIAQKLQNGIHVEPESFDCVTVYFSDIVGFTTICSQQTPTGVVSMLNQVYNGFDAIINQHDAFRVEVIGDAYLIASGVPNRNGNNHVIQMAKLAFRIIEFLKRTTIKQLSEKHLEVRIGIHSGPVAAGVVGISMPRYCLFGDTVNMASRMESSGEGMKVHISQETMELIRDHESGRQFDFISRGLIQLKGKGACNTFWLTDKNNRHEHKHKSTYITLPQR